MDQIPIPQDLIDSVGGSPEGMSWLDQLPQLVQELHLRWRLQLDPPFEEEVTCSWVATCTRGDGSAVVLKVGLPHMEAQHEIHGLLFWNGDPTVYVLESDVTANACLLERCQPGTTLRQRPEPEQDEVIAELLRRLWRTPSEPHGFRPLSIMTRYWAKEALKAKHLWPDTGIGHDGIQLFETLPQNSPEAVLLATDLHAGNVLTAEREPWLVIDPKPFVGDPAYDATQHLLNCMERLRSQPLETVNRLADLLGVDRERVRLWTFARLATQSRDREGAQALVRRLKIA